MITFNQILKYMVVLGVLSTFGAHVFAEPLESERRRLFESYNDYYRALKTSPNRTKEERDRLKKAYTEPAQRAYSEGFTNWAKQMLNKYFTKTQTMSDLNAQQKKEITAAIQAAKPVSEFKPSPKIGGLKTVSPGVKKDYEEPYREPAKADPKLDGSNIPGELVFSGGKKEPEKKYEPEKYEVIDGKEIPTSLEF